MSGYLNGIDVSNYIPGNIANLCSYFKEKGTPLSVVQVEITGGTYDDAVTQKTEYTILDVVNNGLNLGYYAFVYPEGPNLSSVEAQAQEFVSVYNSIKNNHGIVPNCKIMIDVEEGAFSSLGITPTAEMVKNMIDTFAATVDNELGKQEYVVYSSASFISNYYGEVDTNRFGLIVSSINGTYPANQINYPQYPYSPENYSSYPNNWGNNWTGVQFNFGSNEDYDIYKNTILLGNNSSSSSNSANKTVNNNYNIGEYVKIKNGIANFAPNEISNSEKSNEYIIEKVEGNLCELSSINEFINFNDLIVVENNSSGEGNSGAGSSSWDNLSLESKMAIFIASNEGFSPGAYPSGGEIGYSTGGYSQYMGGISIPISKIEGIIIIERWVNSQIPQWNSWIEQGGLTLSELSDNEKIALYDFAYNTGGGDNLLDELSNCIATRSGTFSNTFGSFLGVSNPAYEQGIYNRRKIEYNMYFNGPTFGGAVNELPIEYYNIVNNL